MNKDFKVQPQTEQTPLAESTPQQETTAAITPPTTPSQQINPNSLAEKPKKSNGFPIKTILLILVLAAITASLIYIALNQKPAEETIQQATTNAIPTLENPVQTTLSVSSTPIKLSTPSAYSTDITINTGKDMVNKVQLEISYDPKQIYNVSIENGKFFTNPQIFLKNVDVINGRITFAIGVQDGEDGILGQGVLARLNFSTTQKVASTSVSLLPKSEVKADGYSMSVLKSKINALFNLNEFPFKATSSAK